MNPARLLLAFLLFPLSDAKARSGAFEEKLSPLDPIPKDLELLPERKIRDRDAFPLRVRWSRDGTVAAYVGHGGEERRPVLHREGEVQIGEAYDFVDPPHVARASSSVAFRVGRTVKQDRERWWVWWNGKPQFEEDWIGAVSLSPDGTQLARWTQPGARLDKSGAYKRDSLVLRTTEKKKIRRPMQWDDARALHEPVFDAETNKVFAIAAEGGEWFVIGRGRKRYEALSDGCFSITGLEVARGGKSLAFGADVHVRVQGMLTRSHRVVFDGQVLETKFVSNTWPTLSPDGKHVAYKYGSWSQVMGICVDQDAGAGPGFDYVSRAVWDAKGKRVAYAAVREAGGVDPESYKIDREVEPREGEWHLALLGRKGKQAALSEAAWRRVRDPRFSPDGQRVAARVMSGEGWHLAIFDDEARLILQGPAHAEVGLPQFAPEGTAVSYGVRDGRNLAWATLAIGEE